MIDEFVIYLFNLFDYIFCSKKMWYNLFNDIDDRGVWMMNLLQPYSGTYVSAQSARDKLDVEEILAGCDAVDNEADDISNINSKLYDSGSLITAEALSFDGVTVSDSLNDCCDGIKSVHNYILSTTEQIRMLAINAYNNIQSQYNDEAMAKDRKAVKDAEEKANGGN